jgi:hypothetical protein
MRENKLECFSLTRKAWLVRPGAYLQGEQLWWAPTLHLNISFGWKCLPGAKQTNLYYLFVSDEVEKLYIFYLFLNYKFFIILATAVSIL